MGTKVAPTFASGFLEEKRYSISPDILSANFTLYIKENWKRYLDDCFGPKQKRIL